MVDTKYNCKCTKAIDNFMKLKDKNPNADISVLCLICNRIIRNYIKRA